MWAVLSVLGVIVSSAEAQPTVKLGIEVLATEHPEMVRGKKVALLCSPASLDGNLRPSVDRLAKASTVEVIFTADTFFRETAASPEAEGQVDVVTGARVIKIEDPLVRPRADSVKGLDLIVVDVQDLGIRFFQYVTLVAQFLELAREAGIPIIVLDRPNPINGITVSGPVLDVNFRSRFGVFPIPLVYGMTIGELSLYFNKVFGIGAKLTVIGMENYSRLLEYSESGLHWAMPSDHLPEPSTPAYYAVTGFLGELGVFSTGVGTTRPFHFVLAPWIDGQILAQKLGYLQLPGVKFKATNITPMYGLFQQKRTPGIEIVIDNTILFDPFLTGFAILQALFELYPDKIPLANPTVSQGMDTLLGGSFARNAILKRTPVNETSSSLEMQLKEFRKNRKSFLIYQDLTP